MVAAAVDRIIHYGHIVAFEGLTKRMETSAMARKCQETEPGSMPCQK